MSGFQGKRYEDWHPVLIPGTTADEARAKAEKWWADELAKAEAKEVSRAEQADRMRALGAAKKAARQ
jgi:hypothetical protein